MSLTGKLLSSLTLPPGIFILAMFLLSVWVIRKQSHKLIGACVFLIALVMYITSVPIFALYLNNVIDHLYQRQMPPENVKSAIVVLAGGIYKDENDVPFQPEMHTIERLYAAVKLSKENLSCKYLIMSGCDGFDESATLSVAEIMEKAAETMGCKAQIILDDKSRNTDENLKYSAEIVKKLGVKHVVIVTSNSHMARAMNFARKYMPEDIKIYAYPSGGYRPKRELTYVDFLPDVRALAASCVGIKELIGNVVAKLSAG